MSISGRGLFTGVPAEVTLHPAPAGHGVRFRRADLTGEGGCAFAATVGHVSPEARRTVLAADPDGVRAAVSAGGPSAAGSLATVQTVEHLLSALVGLGITDMLVEVRGPEIPAGDGSSRDFVEAALGVGLVEAAATPGAEGPAPVVVIEPIRVCEGGSVIEALPLSPTERAAAAAGEGPAAFYTYNLDYSNFPIAALAEAACRRIPPQGASIALPLIADAQSRERYAREVAPARTFCLAEEAQAMRSAGMFTHLTPRDMLVIGDDGPIDNRYRLDGEPARHKLLDLIGDLALCGRPIVGRIVATRTGHAQNHEMARRLAQLCRR